MLNPHIVQVKGAIVGKDYDGKWVASVSEIVEGIRIVRYLKKDGTWGKTTDYHDSSESIVTLLGLDIQPDFSVDWKDHYAHQVVQEDMERMMDDDYDDDMY